MAEWIRDKGKIMFGKFLEWLGSKRKAVGYTIGGLNLLAAINYYLNGQHGMAVTWTVISVFLIWDAAEYQKDNNG
jgi:hypothetical protein